VAAVLSCRCPGDRVRAVPRALKRGIVRLVLEHSDGHQTVYEIDTRMSLAALDQETR